MKNYYEEDQKLFTAVTSFIEGNQESYYVMYDLSIKYIYKIVFDIIKDHHATEDLVQETYLTIYKKIDTLDDVSKFYAWAGRIATNHTFRYISKNKRELLTLDSEDGESEFAFEVAAQDKEEFIPENILMDKEKQRLIAQIVDGLSTEQKLAVQYFYYEEMSVTEIAETMGCAKGTIMSRLNYARKAIKAAVVDLAENKGTKLYCLGALPLFRMVFRYSVESFILPTTASGIVAEVQSALGVTITRGTTAIEAVETAGSASMGTTAGVGTVVGAETATSAVAEAGVATGASIVAEAGVAAGAGIVAETGVAAGAGAAAGTGAVGVMAKTVASGVTKGILGKLGASLGVKIAAGVLAAGLLTTGGIILHNANIGDDSDTSDVKTTIETEAPVLGENDEKTEETKLAEETTQEIIPDISEVGQIIEFGHYEQDGDLSNGMEPVEWEVLSIEEGRALLISKYILDEIPFSGTKEHKTWEDSMLRMWLNDTFLNTAFTEEEQEIIPIVTIANPGNEYSRLEATADTQDRIFVLSVEEVFQYYDFAYFDEEWNIAFSEELLIEPTKYAIEQGVIPTFISEELYIAWESKKWSRDVIGKTIADWWLRTPSISTTVCVVSQGDAGEGCYRSNYFGGMQNVCIGVRPALYVNVVTDSAKNESLEEDTAADFNSTPEPAFEDYVIDWKDTNLETAMREVTGIYDRGIMYSDVKDITDLNLSSCSISDISALGSLTNLTKLNLESNSISDISALITLTNLTSLNLGYNRYISDISVLGNLTKLEKLWLRHNNISDISILSNLTNLTDLHLGVNNISDISALSSLTNLTDLHLDGNNISDLSALSKLINLDTLSLSHINLNDISVLGSLTNLRVLDLSSTGISDISVLSNLTNLYYLHLRDNNITDYSPVEHVPDVK